MNNDFWIKNLSWKVGKCLLIYSMAICLLLFFRPQFTLFWLGTLLDSNVNSSYSRNTFRFPSLRMAIFMRFCCPIILGSFWVPSNWFWYMWGLLAVPSWSTNTLYCKCPHLRAFEVQVFFSPMRLLIKLIDIQCLPLQHPDIKGCIVLSVQQQHCSVGNTGLP